MALMLCRALVLQIMVRHVITDGNSACHSNEISCRCYVDKSCPGARPDSLVPGLYYSYDACTDDQDALERCNWKNQDNTCLNRTVIESSWESTSRQTEIKVSTMIMDGTATFTDLGSVMVGKYKLTVQAQFPSGPLTWKYKGLIAIRPSVARMMKLVQAPAVALPGTPLQSQPTVQLTDIYGNPVLNDKICTAVTATVASWAGKATSGLGLESPRRYIYGQKIGDNNMYPYGCSTDPNLLCRFSPTFKYLNGEMRATDPCAFSRITSNAVNSFANFTAMKVFPYLP